ncbi:DUF4136 domain-containing protein [Marimonas sp. MJW-29]|uniref:DUF4136 domain-containing protein n=1 Tax=Sulfitobacter sediminis TaxID=3234186 RepID=A0ABV3RHU7_9RHOB
MAIYAVALLILSACAPNVYSRADPSQDFSQLRTFTWAKVPPLIKTGDHPISPQVEVIITEALKAEFESKGYRFVSTDTADFAVSFTLGAQNEIELQERPTNYHKTYDDWGWGGRNYGPGYDGPAGSFSTTRTEPVEVTEGTLSVDAFDVSTQRPIWHSQASRRLSEAELAGASRERLAVAASNILSDFPSRTAVAAKQ